MTEARGRAGGGLWSEGVVLATNNGDIGGGEVMLLSIAAALEEQGVAVTVVGPSQPGRLVAAARAAGHPVVELEASGRRAWMRALRRWDASSRRGVLWCNGLVPAAATAGRPRRIVHLHQRPSGLQRALVPLARAGALATLVPSRYLADLVRGATVLPNWCAPVLPTARHERGDGPVVLGFLGRPSVAKGVRVLAAALARLDAAEPGAYRLLLAGEPRFVSERERREVESALVPVAALVERPGWLAPADFFARVDLVVVPSIEPESFGLVAAEAMSARTPVLVSDAGALPEVVGPSISAISPADDADALAASIAVSIAASTRGDGEDGTKEKWRRWSDHFSPAAGADRLALLLRSLEERESER
ncbi:glycosyltransferase involved in cell wall biosynthesis [Rathayibacter sp. PhB93]|uniref:glycosyltransferase family 4 protein n=1 Tax=unclassified Rathayibacter TaxID=2609250 RepID=UPI000F465597|nr:MULTISPECIES: glycosyltransferase family 4 protein [unclassified Rathayibacter]ROQ15527.1 glycosyltransferase involved in cell wall biosynthesis [Rathayibacter sp. PhB93]TDQ15465.1 glycosyltransferase involved in cell wall biosynthesis [Rathayibacter sp. PhB1]